VTYLTIADVIANLMLVHQTIDIGEQVVG